jgi:hypothetical protein
MALQPAQALLEGVLAAREQLVGLGVEVGQRPRRAGEALARLLEVEPVGAGRLRAAAGLRQTDDQHGRENGRDEERQGLPHPLQGAIRSR